MPDAGLEFSDDTGSWRAETESADAVSVEPGPVEAGPVEAGSGEATSAAAAPVEAAPVEAAPVDADEVLLAAVDVARTALLDITPADTIGEPVGHVVESEHVLSLLFECTMTGYPGWHWNVSMSRIDANSEPFVLETELMPGGEALLAPDWIPWSERLSDYRAAQDLVAAQAAADARGDDEDEEFSDDELDEDDELDDEELDEDDELDDEELDEDEDELDAELDEDDLDDHGDDVLDGIDFEAGLTASELHPGEAGEAQSESDDGAPEPPAETGAGEFVVEDDHSDEQR
jgi:Protein of unknown function (DUF3027)